MRTSIGTIPAQWVGAMAIFEGKGPIWETLERAAVALDRENIPYAVIGGVACFLHGYRRNTADVGLLVSANQEDTIRKALEAEGLGFDEQLCEFRLNEATPLHLVMSGTFPGKAPSSSITFPEPDDPDAVVRIEGVPTLSLPKLIELKLASALGNPRRARDGADVMELIAVHALDKRFAGRIHKAVRPEFKRLVEIVRSNPS